MDHANVKFGLKKFSYMCIRNSPVFIGTCPDFDKVIIITSYENDINLIILVPSPSVTETIEAHTMHDKIS